MSRLIVDRLPRDGPRRSLGERQARLPPNTGCDVPAFCCGWGGGVIRCLSSTSEAFLGSL